jgi:hypothetical protein
MKGLIIALLTISLSWPLTSDAQWTPNRIAGVELAQVLLMRLANPRDTDYRVGIVNTSAEFGALISPKGTSATVEHVDGYSTERASTWRFSWTATELFDSGAGDLRFEVIRTKTDTQSCPGLQAAINRFYAELEQVLHDPISLSEMPTEHRPDVRFRDGTSYVLQVWTGARTLVIYPDRDIDVALDRASGRLLGTVGGCVGESPSTIETHSVW